jgi:hypothetical protein
MKQFVSLFKLLLLKVETNFTIEDVQDQLFPVHDIMHAWPKSLKNPMDYQTIVFLFDPIIFWKWAQPWDVTICKPLYCLYSI